MGFNLSDLQKYLVEAPPNQAGGFPSLADLLALSQQRRGPMAPSREIDPGVTWGGRDRNAVQPNDYMNSRFYGQPQEGI